MNVTDAFPYNMVVSAAVAESSFFLPPLDLDPNDYVTIQATFEGVNTGFALQGQINGVPTIMPIGDFPRVPASVLGYVLSQAILDKLFFRMNTQTNARGEGNLE